MHRRVIWIGKDVELPLIGCVAFGIIDRGTNLLQIRPASGCNLSCPFCSVDEGPLSKTRITQYFVETDYLLEYAREIARRKKCSELEMHIDGCGEPTLHPEIVEIVQALSEIEKVSVISMQTNGTLLDERRIEELSEAGLTRFNLTINALDDELARKLAGTDRYELSRVLDAARTISESSSDLLIAPVWMKGVNDSEIPKIIEFARDIGAGKRFPALGIQNYLIHRAGRKMKGVKQMSWKEFYGRLKELETKFEMKLILSPKDFGIYRCDEAFPRNFRKFEKVSVRILAPGWMRGEMLGVAGDRTVTVVDAEGLQIGERVKVRIIGNKHNIYLARAL
ncbi:MAG: uncharacterized protein PWR09_1113 [Archaeoglobi archaeon]|nr:radical SAM protein [Candidatus Mnemosynella bozhongmuii]MDI3502987.1 uncharacterized protein [Archaeoglobi archaeon]